MINGILTELNDNRMVGGMFCDLQKAFDCVNRETLMDELFMEYKGNLKP